jgi:beta-galactosidase
VSETTTFRAADRILFGAAYYPEYLATDRVDEDIRLMAEAGFSLIRVGESVWSTWEPRDGEFDLDWLQPVLDAAWARGIQVLLGTPTYAVPPWLMLKHPEIASESATGVRVPWGARQETDTSHPAFRVHAERIIRAVIARYADHPAVVGYQVDNEPGHQVPHNDHVFADFKVWLLERFGSVEAINAEWNLAHWAHRMTTIDELWRPDGNHVPQYDLAWRRFQAERTTEYIAWQCAIVRELARPDQFVTTCIDPMRSAVHDGDLARVLDVVATNQYLATQSELGVRDGDYAFPPSGDFAPFYVADRGYGMREERFLITETNASSIGFPWFNFPAYDGQWRNVGWAMIARGARAIGYWHWHTMHASWESYWGGILPHSLQPGRVYREIAELGAEIRLAGAAVEGLVPDARVGFVFSMPSRWSFEYHPPIADPSSDPRKQGAPDRAAYERLVYRLYGGVAHAGLEARVLHVEQLLERDPAAVAADLPVLVAAGLVLAGPGTTDWLRAYAAAGGHLVLGIRTATADDDGRISDRVQPAGLADAAGVSYDEFSNLLAPIPVAGELNGSMERLAEGLVPEGARVVARAEDAHFGRWAAATTQPHGAGRITYLGVFPAADLADSLGDWLAAQVPGDAWAETRAAGLQVHGAVNGAGERIRFVHNMSDRTREGVVPVVAEDLLDPDGGFLRAGAPLVLGPWDVRVLREVAS